MICLFLEVRLSLKGLTQTRKSIRFGFPWAKCSTIHCVCYILLGLIYRKIILFFLENNSLFYGTLLFPFFCIFTKFLSWITKKKLTNRLYNLKRHTLFSVQSRGDLADKFYREKAKMIKGGLSLQCNCKESLHSNNIDHYKLVYFLTLIRKWTKLWTLKKKVKMFKKKTKKLFFWF